MSKAIIRTVPAPTSPGKAILTEANSEWNLDKGAELICNYPQQPQGQIVIGDVYECTVTGTDRCNAVSWVEHGTLAKGNVTSAPADKLDGRITITEAGNPNPFNIIVGDILRCKAPMFAVKMDDSVECLPTGKTIPFCDVISVLVHA